MGSNANHKLINGGSEKNPKINDRPHPFIRHPRVSNNFSEIRYLVTFRLCPLLHPMYTILS